MSKNKLPLPLPPPACKQCLTCTHWVPIRILEVGAEGQCHLNPPVPVYAGSLGVRSVLPVTKGQDHCAQWRQRPPQVQQQAQTA